MKKYVFLIFLIIFLFGTGSIMINAASKGKASGKETEADEFIYKDSRYKIESKKKHTVSLVKASAETAGITGKYRQPGTVRYNGEKYTVIKIEAYAFQNSTCAIKLPSGIKEVSPNSFGPYVRALNMSETSIQKIPENLFEGSSDAEGEGPAVKKVVLPADCKKIERKAFFNCKKLKNISIPGSVTKIKGEAFCKKCMLTFSNGDVVRYSNITAEPKIQLTADLKNSSVRVTVSETDRAKGYFVFVKAVDVKEYKMVKAIKKDGSKKRAVSVKNLKKNEYEFMVMAYAMEGRTAVYGPLSSLKHISVKVNHTVKHANEYNYNVTMNKSGKMLTKEEINKLLKDYGTYTGTPGMPKKEYLAAMKYEWKDVTRSSSKWVKTEVGLSNKYTYEDLVGIMRKLSAYSGVRLYLIGKSTSGKNMYALDVDLTNCAWEDRHTVLLTGQVHARETAGPVYILREISDILNAYQKGDKKAVETLADTRFVCVACVNPDGHDGIGFDVKHWTYSGGQLWKATSNGTDINRNFPGLGWMQLKYGVSKTKLKSDSPTKVHYCGPYAGSAPETKAMMKFYQYFIGVEQAVILVDYHQQGRITYAGKGYAPKANNTLSENLRKACGKTQEKGTLGKRYTYDYEDNEKNYGLHGGACTNTDYAWAVALGTKFSTKYGFSVYVDSEGNEYPLVMVPTYSKAKAVDSVGMRSKNFRSMSWEIGYGSDYLGYSDETRKLLEKEFFNYNFDEMLHTYAEEARK